MILSIQLCSKHSGRISGKKRIVFKDGVNTIIGPNGSGKSSLLKALYDCPDCQMAVDTKTTFHYFNSEMMNPYRNEQHFKGAHGSIIKVRAMFSSHGETLRDVLRFVQLKPGDVFLLDEPDTGHDIGWSLKIRRGLDILIGKGCQIIAASHHPVFFQNTNIIELKRGYKEQVIKKFQNVLNGQKTGRRA